MVTIDGDVSSVPPIGDVIVAIVHVTAGAVTFAQRYTVGRLELLLSTDAAAAAAGPTGLYDAAVRRRVHRTLKWVDGWVMAALGTTTLQPRLLGRPVTADGETKFFHHFRPDGMLLRMMTRSCFNQILF